MRTHQLAALFRELADLLDLLPDADLQAVPGELLKLRSGAPASLPTKGSRKPARKDNLLEEIGVLPKHELMEFIEGLQLPILVRRKDSTVDVASKVKTLLQRQPDYRRKVGYFLRRRRPPGGSQPLSKALDTLFGNRDEVPTAGR